VIIGAALALSLVRTTIPLGALGYPQGIALDGGATGIRLPVHTGLKRVLLHFPITAGGSLNNGSVQVEVNGREVASAAGDRLRDAMLDADVPIDGRASVVEIVLLSRFTECASAPAASVRVSPQGTVTFVQDADRAREAASTYTGAFTVLEPAHADATWQSSALTAAYALHVLENWRRIRVTLASATAPDSLGVRDPQSIVLPRPPPARQKLSLADLGVTSLDQHGERVSVQIPFTLAQLGGAPQQLVAHLAMRASAAGRLTVLFDGREINEFSFAPGEHAIRVPLPSAALRGSNLLHLDAAFDHPARFCDSAAPSLAIDDSSTLQWAGRADIPQTLERQIGELSGRVTLASDPSIFPHAFAVVDALGSINRSIEALDTRTLPEASTVPGSVIEIGAPPDIAPNDGRSYGEVRIAPGDRILVSYVGDPAVLDRLVQLAPQLAGSNATRFVFGTTGAVVSEDAPLLTRTQTRQRIRIVLYVAFGIVLVIATALIARRARRFS
jgi:hypothetical protein